MPGLLTVGRQKMTEMVRIHERAMRLTGRLKRPREKGPGAKLAGNRTLGGEGGGRTHTVVMKGMFPRGNMVGGGDRTCWEHGGRE